MGWGKIEEAGGGEGNENEDSYVNEKRLYYKNFLINKTKQNNISMSYQTICCSGLTILYPLQNGNSKNILI